METVKKSEKIWSDMKGIDLVESITVRKGTESPITFSQKELKKDNPYKKCCGTVVTPIWRCSYNLAKPFLYKFTDQPVYKIISQYMISGYGEAKLPKKYQEKYLECEHFTFLIDNKELFFPDETSLKEYIKRRNEGPSYSN